MQTPSYLGSLCTILCAYICAINLTSANENSAWNVNTPPGPSYQAKLDTRTGTWMSVDISPDNKTIVFDLLGDIYTLPISGGRAKAITSGMAWDMQARFSPDGKQLVYVSDAGGGDNIWLMDSNGNNRRQITQENFRLLNNPVWSPDGRFIAARKHFTSNRSLGAGEIWLYHVSGGNGLQLNKRPNEQKDLGEPAFSQDGRYVYFSRDSTAGKSFEYSKDSNKQIYEIFAIDRHTGDIETIVSGPGGAVRPTPSPDGKYLAFVRRIRNQSSIFLKNLTTDETFSIYHDLDRDMQETWAIHGVYPSMAWTSNSNSLVFWAKGKLWKLNINNRTAKEIPFHVKDTREMRETIKFKNKAYSDKFNTNMLRWVSVSPNKKQAVYQALGYLYTQDLPNGRPRRLSKQTNHYELYPSFSSDGKWIVYTTWNDKELGNIRKISSKGGNSKKLSATPGLFIHPRFSPNGKHIVYQKTKGRRLVSSHYSSKPGIYTISSSGGKANKVSKDGTMPFFNKSSNRIFMTRQSGYNQDAKSKLISVDLNGNNLQEHITTDFASQFTISPDETWLAYIERYHVYLTPFVNAGKAIHLNPNTHNLPLKKLSLNAGYYLQWSADSRDLYWSLGAKLFQLPIKGIFNAKRSPHNNKTIDEKTLVTSLGFTANSDKPNGITALTNARIITMKGDEVIDNGTILIRDNRIENIGNTDKIKIPGNAFKLDLKNKTIIPGLIDAHWHGSHGTAQIVPQQNWYYYATLAFGVTTIHDPSADSTQVFTSSEMQKAGLITAPRVFSTGTILYGARSHMTAEVNNFEQANTHLKRMKALGAFSVKSYNQPRRDQRQQLLAAARDNGMLIMPEGGSLFQHNMTMIVDGHTTIEHSIPVATIYDDVKQLWSQSRTAYTPTMGVAFGGIAGERYWHHHTDVWKHPILSKYVPEFVLWPQTVRRYMAPEEDYNHFNNARVVAQLNSLGVKTNAGGHGEREGLGLHWELWMFAQGGMPPLEVIRSGTLNAAQTLGMEQELGSLEKGKLADLVVLDENPLKAIYSTDKVHMVMVNGRLYDVHTMHQIGNHAKKREPFFFELKK